MNMETKARVSRRFDLETWSRLCADEQFLNALHADGATEESVAALAESIVAEWREGRCSW